MYAVPCGADRHSGRTRRPGAAEPEPTRRRAQAACKRGVSGGFRLRPARGGPVRNDGKRGPRPPRPSSGATPGPTPPPSSFRTGAPPRRGRAGTHGATGTGRGKRGASGGFRLRPACGGPVRNDDKREGAAAGTFEGGRPRGRPQPNRHSGRTRRPGAAEPEPTGRRAQAAASAVRRVVSGSVPPAAARSGMTTREGALPTGRPAKREPRSAEPVHSRALGTAGLPFANSTASRGARRRRVGDSVRPSLTERQTPR